MKQITIGGKNFNILTSEEIAKLSDNRLTTYLKTARNYRGRFVDHCPTCWGKCVSPGPKVHDDRVPALDWAIAATSREKQSRKTTN